jgi:hypothetical protein
MTGNKNTVLITGLKAIAAEVGVGIKLVRILLTEKEAPGVKRIHGRWTTTRAALDSWAEDLVKTKSHG